MYSKVDRFFDDIKNKEVAFCGIGRSNIPLIKMFCKKGISVTACDSKADSELLDVLEQLDGYNVKLNLGRDYLDNINADIIFRTPGMNFYLPRLQQLINAGAVVTSEMEVFFDLCPCKIIAVTGSDGKTTTTSIISQMLKAQGKNVFLGGNIGSALLDKIYDMKEEDFAVVELSSFQLISMRRSPYISVVTNISPNHLDVHKNMEEYISAKMNIFLHQTAFEMTVLNADNDITRSFHKKTRARTFLFSTKEPPFNGAYLDDDGNIYMYIKGESQKIMSASDIKIPGKHNVENYLAAICAVFEYVNSQKIVETARTFSGVEHRMEFVREIDGVQYYNDSIATSPTRAIKGTLSLYPQKIIMIAGGYDKHIPFNELSDVICDKVKLLILMGDTANKIKDCVEKAPNFDGCGIKIEIVKSMEDAVKTAREGAKSHDIVSLCPACASFGLYRDFVEKGRHFKKIVNELRR